MTLFFCFFTLSSLAAHSENVSIKDLLASPDTFDGKVVTVEGELIGEPLKAKGGTWLNLSWQESNLGIFAAEVNSLPKVKYWGGYGVRGDEVKVVGKFYKNCPLHKGLDVHAQKIDIIAQGVLQKETVKAAKIKLARIFFIICLTVIIIYFIKLRYDKARPT